MESNSKCNKCYINEYIGFQIPSFPKRLMNTNDLRQYETKNLCNICLPDKYAVTSHVWGNFNCKKGKYNCNWIVTEKYDGEIQYICTVANYMDYDWIWHDTSCIDQNSQIEKNSEIPKMRQYYKDSDCCLVFMHGITSNEFDIINIINKELLNNDSMLNNMINNFEKNDNNKNETLNNYEKILSKFFDNEWFTRIWTLQEFILPNNLRFIGDDVSIIEKNVILIILFFLQY